MKSTAKGQGGFTLIEILVTMAIIALIAAIAIPVYNNILYKSRRNALAADAKILFEAFVTYSLDQGQYPPCCSPPEEAFDRANLWPLTRYEYIRNPQAILSKLDSNLVTDYDSPDNPTQNHDFYALLTHGRDDRIQILIADTDEWPDADGQDLYGTYVVEEDGTLTPLEDAR